MRDNGPSEWNDSWVKSATRTASCRCGAIRGWIARSECRRFLQVPGGKSTGGASGTQCAASEGGPYSAVVGDYWVYRDGGDCVLFDAGPVGPDHLPAHAHADLLSFEASLGGRRLFVDSGVSSYEDDPARRYCRSTAAHNVLQVDGVEQCDLWSKFRMGYRGHPFGFRSGREAGFAWARACHDAYRRVGVPTVGRWIGCRPGGPWLCLDWAEGRGRHELTLRLHLHPDVTVEPSANGEVRLLVGSRECRLRFLTPGKIAVADGWYCRGFGHCRPAPVIQFSTTATLPAVCGWSLWWDETQPNVRLEGTDPARIILHWGKDDILLKGVSAGIG